MQPSASTRRTLTSAFIGLSSLVLFSAAATASQAFFVSPDGDDSHTGLSEAQALESFGEVLSRVAALPKPWTGDVVVQVMAGDYFLDSTIELTSAHSGDNGHQLILRNHGALASPVLIGGQALDPSQWTLHQDGIYSQDLPGVERIDILYHNRRKARKARFPNHEFLPEFPVSDGAYFTSGQVSSSSLYITAQSQDLSQAQLTDLNTDIQNGTDAYLVVWGHGHADWHKWAYPITHTTPASGRIYVSETNPNFHQGSDTSQNRYYIEGGLRQLDAAGEFHFDPTLDRLYYKPDGWITDEIIYSTVNNILTINGASNIRIEGLQFACSGVLPYTDSAYTWTDPDAAVSITNSSSIEITSCHFKSTGQSAINLESSHDNRIEDCLLQYLGQSGIKLYQSDRNTIRNCLIHDIGLRRVYCEGVAIHVSEGNTVSQLEIYNSARYGVTVRGRVNADTGADGRPTRNNTVEYVRMHDVNQDSGDTAGLHMAKINADVGVDFVNSFNQIIVTRSIAQPNITDEWKPTGVYLDHREQVMNQAMRNIEVRHYDPRYPGYVASRFSNLYGTEDRTSDKQRQIMQNRPWNNDSSTEFNCSWEEDFDHSHMAYAQIGLTAGFPAAYAAFSINNEAPYFTRASLSSGFALVGEAYTASLAGSAVDPEGDPITFSKVSGPNWLSIGTDGSLSGSPSASDLGSNTFSVRISDGLNAAVETDLSISVYANTPTVAYWNARGGDVSTVPDLVGSDHSLSGAAGIGASGLSVAPNPVPNPDAITNGASGSVFMSSASIAPATSNATAFKLTSANSFTLEGWLLHDVSDGSQSGLEYLAGDRHNDGANNYRGWHLVVASGRLQIFAEGTTLSSTTAIDDGVAHHFAVVWDHESSGGEFRLYVDGALEGTAPTTPVTYTQPGFTIGGRCISTDGIYNDNILQARLDELRFSGAALAPSQFLSAQANNFTTWIGSYGLAPGEQGMEDDPDRDGLSNGLEAFFGTDPTARSVGLSLIRQAGNTLTVAHPNPDSPLADLSGTYQWSLDLLTWHASDGIEGDGSTTLTTQASEDDPSDNTTTVTATIDGPHPSQLFLRVKVSEP